MSVVLYWKKRELYDFSASVFESLYNNLLLMYLSKEFDLSDDAINLINHLEVPGGMDLSKYIYTKEDFLIFNKMVRIGLDRMYSEYPDLPEYSVGRLENFYNQLVEIAKTY